MFRKSVGTDELAATWLDFTLREITGRWVSPEGAPSVRIFRNRKQKNGGLWLELTYNNPQAVFSSPIKDMFGVRYFDLFGRIGLAYDAERDVLQLSAYGEYVRAVE